MNKVLRGTLLFSILTSMSMADVMYFGGGVVSEDLGSKDNGIAAELSIGKTFYNNFGIEGKISKTLTVAEDSEQGIDMEGDVTAISVFATYSHVLSPEFTIMPKIGFTQFSLDAKFSDSYGNSLSIKDSSVTMSYGVDLKYKMNNKTNIYASFTQYKPGLDKSKGNMQLDDSSNPRHLSIGIQQKF